MCIGWSQLISIFFQIGEVDLSFVHILDIYSSYDVIFMWQNSMYHPTYYEMTSIVFEKCLHFLFIQNHEANESQIFNK